MPAKGSSTQQILCHADRPRMALGLCEPCYKRQLRARPGYHESYNQFRRSWYHEKRREALIRYGGQCHCCGEANLNFLTFDHLANDGGKQRRAGLKSYRFFAWLLAEKREGIAVACYNCNCARAAWGVCPHKTELSTE